MNLVMENISFAYNSQTEVLTDFNLTINDGEMVAIIGHNGSGKSTIAKLIIGLLKPDKGNIYVDGELLTEDTVEKVRRKVGIIFQNPDNQFVGVTVKDDIAFGLENRRYAREDMLKLIDEFSKLVGMEKFLEANPETLSGGEKQRVAIAGILAYNPNIIIFDEATSMLDPRGIREVNEVINSLKGQKTIIAITHNLREAINADRIIVMNDGKIVLDGKPEEVFKEKEILKQAKLDILESMKLIELIEDAKDLKYKKEIEEILWELTFQK